MWKAVVLLQALNESEHACDVLATHMNNADDDALSRDEFDTTPHTKTPSSTQPTDTDNTEQIDNTRATTREGETAPENHPSASTQASTRKPLGVFLRKRREVFYTLDTDEPETFKKDGLPIDTTWNGFYRFKPSLPLVSFSQLQPLLFHSLSHTRTTTRLDTRRLVQQMAQVKPLLALPKATLTRWPRRLWILVDHSEALEPYWQDFQRLCEQCQALLGSKAVYSVRFDEENLLEALPHSSQAHQGVNHRQSVVCQAWPSTGDEYEPWQTFQWPSAEASVLILSDIGSTRQQLKHRHAYRHAVLWQRLIRQVTSRVSSERVLLLNPSAAQPSPVKADAAVLKLMPLHDHSPPARQPRKRLYSVFPLITPSLQHTVLRFLAPLPLVDVGLLRRLRLAFQWGGSELESVIWNHDAVQHLGPGIRVKPEQRSVYLNEPVKMTTEEWEQLWQCVAEQQQDISPGLHHLQQLAKHVYAPVSTLVFKDGEPTQTPLDAETLEYFQQLIASTRHPDTQLFNPLALTAQCGNVLAQCETQLFQTAHADLEKVGYQLFGLVNERALKNNEPLALPPGFDLQKLQWLWQDLKQAHTQVYLGYSLPLSGRTHTLQIELFAEKPAHLHPNVLFSINTLPDSPITLRKAASTVAIHTEEDQAEVQVLNFNEPQEIPCYQPMVMASLLQEIWFEAVQRPESVDEFSPNQSTSERELLAKLILTSQPKQIKKTLRWQIRNTETRAVKPNQPAIVHDYGWSENYGDDVYGLYRDKTIGNVVQRFRWIPPGEFIMGDDHGSEDEKPAHRVVNTRGFWLADTVVTQALWQEVMSHNPSEFKGDQNPVENVSWNNAQQFIQRLKKRFHLECYLPTEAQWEYACRAGTTTSYFFGEQITHNQAHFSEKELGDAKTTVEVKAKPANAWGLYQMHGNVWEWCQDIYDKTYYQRSELTDPCGPSDLSFLKRVFTRDSEVPDRVLRGGSWRHNANLPALGGPFLELTQSTDWYDAGFRLALKE